MKRKVRYIAFIIILILFDKVVIGQSCLNYSTFFGDVLQDEVRGLCSDPQKNVYVIGNTYNTNLPVTPGAFQSTPKGSYEAFLAKFDSCGTLVWCTYFGTSTFDSGEKITYSNDNTIVFCGYTDGIDLSTTSNAMQPANAGGDDCFVAKFNLNGQPQWVSYFGSTGSDFAYDIKTDSLSNIIFGGTSLSNTLYTTSNSFQQINSGATDAFITRLDKKGNVKFSTFYGGTNSEDIHALAIDKNYNIIGVGGSFSINLNTSVGCYQSVSNGGMEVYVLKLDSTGQRLFSTYIGDIGTDDAYGVATDNSNHIYVSGHTNSSGFYTSPGAFQSVKAGGNDCYCLSLSPSGGMLWSTFIGTVGNDFLARMNINANKELVLYLSAQGPSFPMLGVGNTTVNAGGTDGVVVKFLTNGMPFWSSYIGGASTETPHDVISIDKNKIIVAGTTSSSNYPVSTGAYQTTFKGTEDGVITCMNVASSILANVDEVNTSCLDGLTMIETENQVFIKHSCARNLNYSVYDMTGKCLLQGIAYDDVILLQNLKSVGIYLILLSDETGNFEQKRIFKQ